MSNCMNIVQGISNCMYTVQGDFVCNKDIIEHFNDLPSDIYQESCKYCSLDDDKLLKCSCKNNQQKYSNTELDLNWCNKNNPNIRNLNSVLTCDELPFPNGSYKNTCKKCILSSNNNNIFCTCKKDNGNWVNTKLNNCKSNNVVNNNGELTCL